MSKAFYDTLRFGILGGGQLGRMLLQKAADFNVTNCCLLYTSDAADERSSVDLGGRRIIKKKNN